jgi:mRNA interferase MazF
LPVIRLLREARHRYLVGLRGEHDASAWEESPATVADRIGAVVVAVLTRTRRDLVSELDLTAAADGVPTDCVVSFDNVHTTPRTVFRRHGATYPRRE